MSDHMHSQHLHKSCNVIDILITIINLAMWDPGVCGSSPIGNHR